MSKKQFILSAPGSEDTHSSYARKNIIHNIMLCNLEPGDIINEADLADIMGISRTPVHEAVLSLRDTHLIDVIPRRESRVSYINLEYVNEGIFLRCSLEAELIKSLAGNIPSEYISKLKANLEEQQILFRDRKDLDGFYNLDDEFHKYLYIAANKTLTYNSVSSICSHLNRVRYLVRLEKDVEIEESSLHEHMLLLTYLTTGVDPSVDLNIFFKRHIMRFQKKLPEYMKNYNNYFVIGK